MSNKRTPPRIEPGEEGGKAMACLINAHNHMVFSLFESSNCICEQQRNYEDVTEALLFVLREYYTLRKTCKAHGIGVVE